MNLFPNLSFTSRKFTDLRPIVILAKGLNTLTLNFVSFTYFIANGKKNLTQAVLDLRLISGILTCLLTTP